MRGAQDVRQEVDDAVGITPIGDLSQLCGNPEPPVGRRHSMTPPSEVNRAAVHLLAGNSWKGERA
jgi:hypothetical protein